MVCEEWHRVSRDKFLLSSSIRPRGAIKIKKNQLLTKRWQLFAQFVMHLQNSLPMDYVDGRNMHGFSRGLDSWTRGLLWATEETNHVKLGKYSELEIVGGYHKVMGQVY